MKKNETQEKIKGYKINFADNTFTMNYKFAAAATTQIGSAEYNILKAVKEDFPQMTIITKSGREKKSARPNKRLTYKNMETYIRAYTNDSEEALVMFEKVKNESKSAKSPYKYVSDWFKAQFPNYKKASVSDTKIVKLIPLHPEAEENEKQVVGL